MRYLRSGGRKRPPFLFAERSWLSGPGFGALWSPIFGWKSNAPELRARRGEFQTNFSFLAPHGAKKNYVALLLFFGVVVAELERTAAGDARMEQDQRAVRVDRKGIRSFTEVFALRVVAGHLYADLHQNPL